MPVFLGISGVNLLFFWWHSLRLILAGKIKLSLAVISMRCYNIISWTTQAWLSNIKEGISECHTTQDFSVTWRCNKENCQWQVLEYQGRAERSQGCLRSSVVCVWLWWMKWTWGNWSCFSLGLWGNWRCFSLGLWENWTCFSLDLWKCLWLRECAVRSSCWCTSWGRGQWLLQW